MKNLKEGLEIKNSFGVRRYQIDESIQKCADSSMIQWCNLPASTLQSSPAHTTSCIKLKFSIPYVPAAMTQSDENHYKYFSGLDRRIKTAIACYAFCLLSGITIAVFDVDPFRSLFVPVSWRGLVLAFLVACILVICILLTLRQIADISRVNSWFDKRLFGLMDTSDTIMKNTILDAAATTHPISAEERSILAETIVNRLSEHDQIYRTMFQSGMFSLWAWYWIVMYGSITFSGLVVLAFCAIAPGLAPDLRLLFSWYLALALGHIALTVFIGRRLQEMTRTTAQTIASSYRADIEMIITNFSRPSATSQSPTARMRSGT
jgi:hypothetical protein